MGQIGTQALLFQTGYLTVTGEEELGGKALYRLGYPNREVRQSLNEHLLRHLVQDVEQQTANSMRLQRLLATHDCAGLQELFHAVLREHSLRMAHQQRHSAVRGVLRERFLFVLRGVGVRDRGGGVEQPRAPGHGGEDRRARIPVRVQGSRAGGGGVALAQLRERGYADKYRGRGEPIHLIGVELSRQTRNVTAFELADG